MTSRIVDPSIYLVSDVLSDPLVNEGIGPGGVMKFDVTPDIVAAAKQRFAIRDELFATKASG